ncbi:hypothetical protein [uncultured Paracoccus sp.]|nr:hypothetical protein [uncultured Paracoccus sp.]
MLLSKGKGKTMSDEHRDDIKLARRRLLRNLGLGLGAAYLAPVIVGIDAAHADGASRPGRAGRGRSKASRPSRPRRGRRARVRRRAHASRPSRPVRRRRVIRRNRPSR